MGAIHRDTYVTANLNVHQSTDYLPMQSKAHLTKHESKQLSMQEVGMKNTLGNENILADDSIDETILGK